MFNEATSDPGELGKAWASRRHMLLGGLGGTTSRYDGMRRLWTGIPRVWDGYRHLPDHIFSLDCVLNTDMYRTPKGVKRENEESMFILSNTSIDTTQPQAACDAYIILL
jgi:hypothetical protein